MKGRFGTAAVFLTAISTILGAILFLRFGWAVGNVGFLGVTAIILLGHLVTIPTALAIAEIATNQRVAGGGVYYILSRSFGINVGAAIGIALFLSQAISIAFYVIAFSEAFRPALPWIHEQTGFLITDVRIFSIPTAVLLALLILLQGAGSGMRVLYVVVATLAVSLVMFFLGQGWLPDPDMSDLFSRVRGGESFFKVFAICFPAFTGMAAGVGLSGELRNPRRNIPVGTLLATVVGMLIYGAVAYKLAMSAPPEDLVGEHLVMSRIALWGPIIPIGLAAASLSSALGAFLIAPRTLQALSLDRVFPAPVNRTFSRIHPRSREPNHATAISAVIALFFVVIGDVDVVAQIISMFFMVTYGSICLVSFLEHFAADPSYRPGFRSRWYISLFGALMCVWIMFQMSEVYATLAIVIMALLYMAVSRAHGRREGLSRMFQGAIFQFSRQLQVFLQKSRNDDDEPSPRPSVVCISSVSFERIAAFELLRWISHRYGFGTYLHYIKGYLSRASNEESRDTLDKLVHLANVSASNVYVDTLVSPSYTSAITQVIQLPGISGQENNTILFEFSKREPADIEQIVDNFQLVSSLGFDVLILGSSDRGFGYFREIHLWITPADIENTKLMILLSYILLGHPDWRNAEIRIFSFVPRNDSGDRRRELEELVTTGRLPISMHNVEFLTEEDGRERREVIAERSHSADLTVIGFRAEVVKRRGADLFTRYDGVGNVLFVNTTKAIDLVGDLEIPEEEPEPPEAEAPGAEVPEAGTPEPEGDGDGDGDGNPAPPPAPATGTGTADRPGVDPGESAPDR